MQLLSAESAASYLVSGHRLPPNSGRVDVTELAGGVSNVVLLVRPENAAAFVIKQSRAQLRTDAPWFSRLDRIWREADAMNAIGPLLPTGVVPRVLFEDRENYLFAMEAIDQRHTVWKADLLAGTVQPEIAQSLGRLLADLHGATHYDERLREVFDDREVFAQLRVDPFYRYLFDAHADLRLPLDALIDEMWQTRLCLVHADFSPKNVLVVDSSEPAAVRIALVDFETVHYGDPAFDLGFFLSHLVLKAVRAESDFARFAGLATAFWKSYSERLQDRWPAFAGLATALERRSVLHLAACALARVDGTSPVNYLPGPMQRDRVRSAAREILLHPTNTLASTISVFANSSRNSH